MTGAFTTGPITTILDQLPGRLESLVRTRPNRMQLVSVVGYVLARTACCPVWCHPVWLAEQPPDPTQTHARLMDAGLRCLAMTAVPKLLVPIALFTALAACGSSEAPAADPQPAAPVEASSDADNTDATETSTTGPAVMLTVADGTTFNLVADTCEVNGDEVFLLASNVDGDDEVFFQISQSNADSMAGILQTDYIDGDAEANYTFGFESVLLDADGNPLSDPLVVDGQSVSGTLTMQFSSSQGDSPIFGDAVTAEVQADCG